MVDENKLSVANAVGINEIGRVPYNFSIVVTHDNKYWTYAPKQDITAYELAMFVQLFVCIGATRSIYAPYAHPDDIMNYIKEHKLERHFDITGAV